MAITLLGLKLSGIGAACAGGAVAGTAALFVQQWRPRATGREEGRTP
ncbi:MAG: hypothetical protein ACXWCU_00405 [Caldimonas sp.]